MKNNVFGKILCIDIYDEQYFKKKFMRFIYVKNFLNLILMW